MNKYNMLNKVLLFVMLIAALVGLPYAFKGLRDHQNANLIIFFCICIGIFLGLIAVFLEKSYFIDGENTSRKIWHSNIVIFILYPLLILFKGEAELAVILIGSIYFVVIAFFFLIRRPQRIEKTTRLLKAPKTKK